MHKSVLLNECLEYLNLTETSIVVDCTLGYGGHSSHILEKIKRGFLFAFDQDKDAIKYSHERLGQISDNYEIIYSNFINIQEELKKRNISKVDAILYDLGVSSPQLDFKERGFSFHEDAPLDMRMDQNNSLSAYEVVNNYPETELVRIFFDYGEEKYSKNIAREIVKQRQQRKIKTTLELVEIIKNSVPEKYKREHHPARKVFQAIRIEVNKELDVFEKSLYQALDMLKLNGRICVITFHSLEDSICKKIFNEVSKVDEMTKKLPVVPETYLPKFKVIAKIKPSDEEILENKRARSARLRVIERVRD